MTSPSNDTRGAHRRDQQARQAVARMAAGLRQHGMLASASAYVLAILAMAPQVPSVAVLIAVALLALMPVRGGLRGPTGYRFVALAALGLGWGLLAASALHSHPSMIAVAWMLVAWLAMLPSLAASSLGAAAWTLVCLGPTVLASLDAPAEVGAVGAAMVLLAGAGHGIVTALVRGARAQGALQYDRDELEAATVWLQARAARASEQG